MDATEAAFEKLRPTIAALTDAEVVSCLYLAQAKRAGRLVIMALIAEAMHRGLEF